MSLNKHSVIRVHNGSKKLRLDEREDAKNRQRSRRVRRLLKESGYFDAEHNHLAITRAGKL